MLFQMVKKLLQKNGSVPDTKDPLCWFLPDNFFFTYIESLIGSYSGRGEETVTSSPRTSFCL